MGRNFVARSRCRDRKALPHRGSLLESARSQTVTKNDRTYMEAARKLLGNVFADRQTAVQDIGNTPLRGIVREIVLL